MKLTAKEIQTLSDIFLKYKYNNIFWITACQKGIYFNNKDTDEHGAEMLDALYMEWMLKWN